MVKLNFLSRKGKCPKGDPMDQNALNAATGLIGSVLGEHGFQGPTVKGHSEELDTVVGISKGPGKLADVHKVRPDGSLGEKVFPDSE